MVLVVSDSFFFPVIYSKTFSARPNSQLKHLTSSSAFLYHLPYPSVNLLSTSAITFGHSNVNVNVNVFHWILRPTKLYESNIPRRIAPSVNLLNSLVCTAPNSQESTEQRSGTKQTQRNAIESVNLTAKSARRSTTPKKTCGFDKNSSFFRIKTQPCTIPSSLTSSTHPKRVMGARYAWSEKPKAANTARKK